MWPFSRKKLPITPPQPPLREEQWRTGDVAECICDNWALPEPLRAPQRGSRHFVVNVDNSEDLTFIGLLGYPSDFLWLGYGFRKIVLPDLAADHDVGETLPSRELIDG
jgi:hypothetical protein